jgi:hypothetical protein
MGNSEVWASSEQSRFLGGAKDLARVARGVTLPPYLTSAALLPAPANQRDAREDFEQFQTE